MTQKRLITGPTFAEMLDPSKIRKDLRAKALLLPLYQRGLGGFRAFPISLGF